MLFFLLNKHTSAHLLSRYWLKTDIILSIEK